MFSRSSVFRFNSFHRVFFLSLLFSPTLGAQDYIFDSIGFLSGENDPGSYATHVSLDGNVVLGATNSNRFIWSPGKQKIIVQGAGFSNIGLTGLSADGAVVVGAGTNTHGRREAFRWTAEQGLHSLGFLAAPTADSYSSVTTVSKDGLVIIGDSSNANTNANNYEREAFRWTESGGMQGLGILGASQHGFSNSNALGVSYNGDVVVGYSTSASSPDILQEAFIWTASEGMQGLGFIDGGGKEPQSMAVYLSDNGSVIAGNSTNASSNMEVFYWTKEKGMQGLGFIDGGGLVPKSLVSGMSADGSVITGISTTANSINDSSYQQAFRWTAETGLVGLGYLGIGTIEPASITRGISADGSTIIGASTTADDGMALFVWRNETGMFNLLDALADDGIDLSDWQMADISGVSGNGEVISGTGSNPEGMMEGWLIRLPKPEVTPEPPGPEDPEPEDKPQPPIPPITPPVGFLSLNELNRSMSDMAYVPMSGLSVAQGALQDQRFISTEQCASEGISDKRYCTFITGAGEFWRGDGTQGRGSVGVAVALSPSLSLGVSAYLGNQHYDLRLDGKNKMDSYGGAMFLNYSEGKQGLRAFGAVTASHLDYDLRRHYRNGSYNISRSSGESSGHAIGGMVRLGWAFSPQDRISAIPFAELSWAKATMKGYREHSGTFPIDFDDRKANETDMRLGSELRYDLTDAINVNGGVAWVHRLSGKVDRVSGTVIGWSETSVSAAKLPTDWSEVSLGASYKLTPDMNLSASTTSTIGRSYQPDTSVRAGFSVNF
ncbi:autotransporter domain-containing protein [Pragia fontium]|uniref:Probable extracellular repeat, HAF family n=1 Tax=Pragia fontium DSM 5563 = ATCC 49100 TaxID=1122977 RepID=A0AAJ5BFX8_9GAMM|nr:autotransporter domain-containing protein [Pragia fontium]SFC08853.1 probable extracellular repeat, HAF family [Pragia fontium DSM 5563 = ATCC 49100]SUB81453.1 Esterase EstA precursor [Pragia fontium]VEJ53744.1 Esterase EstA precursor [Pragia fontium]